MTTRNTPQDAATSGTPNEAPRAVRRGHPLRWIVALLALLVVVLVVRSWWPAQHSATPAAAPAVEMAASTEAIPATEEPITVAGVRAAYTASEPEAQRLNFFAPFRSYTGVDEIYTALEKAGYTPQLTSRHAKVPDDVPPSNLDIIEVDGYTHLDQPGKLELQFFNDRLYQAEFQPEDADAYRPLFRSRWPQLRHEKSGRSEHVSGALRIASSLDLSVSDVGRVLNTRPFVLWQDLRLVRQRDDWNYQFARELAP